MAIYSSVPPPEQQVQQQASPTSVDFSLSGFEAFDVPSPSGRKTGSKTMLSIPLGARDPAATEAPAKARREKRESEKGREAMLRGKEGSRRRQRWENGEW